MVDRQNVILGSAFLMSVKVFFVFSQSASASPGPAIPTTDKLGILCLTAMNFSSAFSGVNISDATPGLLSFGQSYFLTQ